MDGQLLVRMYNVGLGDCIYLRVPDVNRDVHILIDCGNKFGDLARLGQCITDLRRELPDAGGGKSRLDLLVVTHPHEDHHKGFEEAFFQDIKIEHLWLSPAYDRQNPKARGFHALQDAAQRALLSLSERASDDLKAEVEDLLSLSKSEAFEMLRSTMPQANGIEPQYVSADTPQNKLRIFEDPDIKLAVLGPMEDIDGYYLGGEGLLNATNALIGHELAGGYQALFWGPQAGAGRLPGNISSQDLHALRSRMQSNALAAAEIAGHVINNLSVVLLLEWHGRRLLFPGDAEWSGARRGEVQKGRSNGSWNVMWHERRAVLARPVDFLKIGHHGSENATPWTPKVPGAAEEHPINQILDHLLPLPPEGQSPAARAIVSTLRTSRWPSIPSAPLLAEIGRRVANSTQYDEPPSLRAVPPDVLQPQRTDLEIDSSEVAGQPVKCIELLYSPLQEM